MIPHHIVKTLVVLLIAAAATFQHIAQAQQQAAPSSNLQLFTNLSRPQLMQVMQDWSMALGVDCSYCHQASFEAETPRKEVARLMQREYVAALKQSDGSAINCQTCHQGNAKMLAVRAQGFSQPSAGNPALRAMRVQFKSCGVLLWRTSTKVPFLPKKHFMEEMRGFNQALGVNCNYCHKKGDFEADTPRKQAARLMRQEFSSKLRKQDGKPVSCNDCHQGTANILARF